MSKLSLYRRGAALAMATVVAVSLSACGSDDKKDTESGKSSGSTSTSTSKSDDKSAGDKSSGDKASGDVKLIKDGILTMCTEVPYKPFEFNKDGKVVGYDVDIVGEVAKALKAEVKVISTPFEGIKTGTDLKVGKCDVAAAGMTITDERKKAMDFSTPYFEATQALIIKKGAGINDLAALKGKTLGVQDGTTGEEYAKKNATDAKLKKFDGLASLMTGLKSGAVDAAINDNGVVYDYAKENEGFEVVKEFNTGEQYGIAVKKGNSALLKVVDETLKKIKADGTQDKIHKKWFGTKKK